MLRDALAKKIFNVRPGEFTELALDVFHFQFEQNAVYRTYCDLLHIHPAQVQSLAEIPFLPVSFFRTHQVVSGNSMPALYFESSQTGGREPARHYVADPSLYEKSFHLCFEAFLGNMKEWAILALLPSYLDRPNASLVYMVRGLMRHSGHRLNGFFLHDYEALRERLQLLESRQQKTLLLGVSFALLDFAGLYPMALHHTTIMETGGMKGRREEITRDGLHHILQKSFSVASVASEFGMTEMLSQAYAVSNGVFRAPPWLRVLARDLHDPFSIAESAGSGAMNIIDLANLDSCCFIATDDLLVHAGDGAFRVPGRVDFSDLRGCNLMVE